MPAGPPATSDVIGNVIAGDVAGAGMAAGATLATGEGGGETAAATGVTGRGDDGVAAGVPRRTAACDAALFETEAASPHAAAVSNAKPSIATGSRHGPADGRDPRRLPVPMTSDTRGGYRSAATRVRAGDDTAAPAGDTRSACSVTLEPLPSSPPAAANRTAG
jgi:hypothetical protein